MSDGVEELGRAERRIRLLESVVRSSRDAVILSTAEPIERSSIVYVNDGFVRIFGYAVDDIVGRPTSSLYAHGLQDDVRKRLDDAQRGRRPITLESPAVRENGESFWCEWNHAPILRADGTCEHWAITARDVTERRQVERMQESRGDLLEMIATDAPIDRIFASIVSRAELVRTGATATLSLRNDADETALIEARSDGTAWSTPIRLADGTVAGTFVMLARDRAPSQYDLTIGDEFAKLAALALGRRDVRERLEFLAHHDALTLLPNRLLFEAKARAAFASADADGTQVAIGLIDLDRFKIVNDSFGHAAGDRLLREVAGRIARFGRRQDSTARLGGDEFVYLMAGIADRDEAARLARNVLASLAASFHCAGQEVFVRASMGIACYPGDAREIDTLLNYSDKAMYAAKAQSRDIAFHEHLENRDGPSRIALETSLAHALERGEFEVVYQPQVDLQTRSIRGAEALLRWNHATLGRVLPEAFIRAAEDTGLVVPLGAWVLDEACRFARSWQDGGFERFVAVNVSARQFDTPEFIETVTQTLARTGLEAARLHLELTESLVMRSPETAATTLAALKALGVKIIIDDFGTGYSSFNYLKRFPLDAFKIDRLFVRDIGFGSDAANDEAIVRAIVGVARALDLGVVAEGIENETQIAFLSALGVPLGQGFYFDPGLPASQVLHWKPKAVRS